MDGKLPNKEQIKVEWTAIHTIILIGSTLFVAGSFVYELKTKNVLWTKYLTVFGLYIDIVGVLIASLKTPFYGIFFDGGQIEKDRQEVERKFFKVGMFLIAFGMILQTIGTLFQ